MGWLKVAEALLNPFGMDDDDFDVNSMIDRNLQMGYLIVDDMHNEHPVLIKDLYWDEIPQVLPDPTSEIFPESEKLDIDIVDYDVSASKSIFGRVSVAVKKYNKRRDIEKGKVEINSKFYKNRKLVPDPNVICDIYKNIPNVQEEQNALNQELERQRRISKEDAQSFLESKRNSSD